MSMNYMNEGLLIMLILVFPSSRAWVKCRQPSNFWWRMGLG